MFLGTAEALAKQVTQENFDKGMIYPPFSNIRKISSQIAANVAAKAYELGEFLFTEFTVPAILHNSSLRIDETFRFAGLATRLPQPEDLVEYAENCMYSPVYRSFR